MINKNVADYTNFGGGKTNKRITQAPGGSTSLSLGWGDDSKGQQKQRGGYDRPSYQQQEQPYGNYNKYGQERHDDGPLNVMSGGYGKGGYDEGRGQQNNNGRKDNVTSKVGGEHGYNNYNPQTQGGNRQMSKGNGYQQYSQQSDYTSSNQRYQQPDPQSLYKPSSSTSNNKMPQQQIMDYALQQQKHKIQSSRGQRSNQVTSSTSNPIYQQQQQSNQQTRPCVKIHQQRNNNIFGQQQYDYWKQDGHNTSQQNTPVKEQPYMYEKMNSQQLNSRGGNNQQYGYGDNSGTKEKTSVKVHNPPGGKSNFTFG